MARKRTSDIDRSRNALGLAEQAFHLLRTAPLAAHCWCYLGMVPFALALLFFFTEMSRGARAEDHLMNASLGVSLVYLWMKVCQSLFCRKLWQQLSPGGSLPPLSLARLGRYGAAQAFLQAFAPVFLALGILFLLPLGWIFAFFQNVTVLGFTLDGGRNPLRAVGGLALRQSHFAAMQNHMVLAVLKAVAIFTWLNVVLICAGLPHLAKMLLGIESVFTQSWEAAYLNSTFLAITFVGAWLVLSPFTKAIYVVRCFEGLSEKSGADLIARLEGIQRQRSAAAGERGIGGPRRALVAMALLLPSGLLATGALAPACAQEGEPPAARQADDRLERARTTLDAVMARPEFEWRMPRNAGAAGTDAAADDGNAIADWIVDTQRAVGKFISDVIDAVQDLINPPGSGPGGSRGALDFGSGLGLESLRVVVYGALAVLVALLLAMLVAFLVRRHRDNAVAQDEESPFGAVNLESEELLADELPEDEWLNLARQQVAKGEKRLAVRALFLAGMAHLASRGFLRIVKSKSNRDYRDELVMKAQGHEVLREAFDANVLAFDRVWYGMHDPTDELVDQFMGNYEAIRGA